MSPDDAADCALVMVAKGLVLAPGFVSKPFVAIYHVAEKAV